ncbi:hypothetical protein GCM10012285_23730 [Streptomyces kronopolitis]|uniref:Tyr recombinase domain-containing protein n=1 Tax=Streptomyces kronopolitis TaxID=1612435 RepID=A0ABQ2J9B1_9ACTN|nr:tyrosine-type recombinase/integrase [Streptomyces kronopolitis]GGN42901.1 hypothetical protein GCM10012285_23730 [Streptomyces kronopolitis]
MRWGEASAVKVGRVDIETRRIRIVEAYGEDKGSLYLDSPKNHELRTVPIPQFLVEELRPYVDGRDADALLFITPQGGALRANNFRRRVFAPAVKAAGLGTLGVTPHKLRHTAASMAIASGVDVHVVQAIWATSRRR